MASKKKTAPKAKTVFVLHDGTRFDVTGEDGKYVYCGNTQFRKSANRGEIRKVEAAEKAETETISAEAEAE